MSRRSFFILSLFGLITGAVFTTVVFLYPKNLLSPVNSESSFSFLRVLGLRKSQSKVIGFLPYWNVKKLTLQPELDTLSFFALEPTSTGDFKIVAEPGFAALQSDEFLEISEKALEQGSELELVIAQFNNETIRALLSNKKSQETFLQNLDSVLLSFPFTGVNIDFEYVGEVNPELREQLTEFMEKLDFHLAEKHPGVTLSIDVYGSAASKDLPWDIKALSKSVDHIVVMAYDYHRSSSSVSGPVAPLLGAGNSWENDIIKHLQAFLEKAPAEKIILGVPFYGYEWQTSSREPGENTYPRTGHTASYSYVQSLLEKRDELQLSEHWDDEALSPYVTYIENGKTYTAYYENERSLAYKLNLVQELNLAGIAIWALGYEADSRVLWDTIASEL